MEANWFRVVPILPFWQPSRKLEAKVPNPDSLFAYGTLLRAEVWERVAQRPFEFQSAWCEGYIAYRVHGGDYPGLAANSGQRTFGGIALGIDQETLQRLDEFEGSQYIRQVITVNCADGRDRGCWAYIWNPEYRDQLSRTQWLPEGVGVEAKRCWETRAGH